MPLFSIITINYNNTVGLRQTIESVINQSFNDYEYWVIDGGSTDGSLDLINLFSSHLTGWVSEKDNGIYHAMNKGILQAKGKYLLFLNSGDSLANKDVLDDVKGTVPNFDIVYGDFILNYNSYQNTCKFPDQLDFSFFTINSIPHSSTFIRRSLFKLIGMYNESYRIVSDWEFFLLAINKFNCSYFHVPKALSVFDMSGVSSSSESAFIIQNEREAVLKKHFPTFVDNYKELHQLRDEMAQLKASKIFRASRKLKRIIG